MSADTTEARVLDWLQQHESGMVALLEAMVNTDGGSYDKAGVDAVGERVKAFCGRHAIPVEVIPGRDYGDCLRATVEAGEGAAPASGNRQRNILLMGHRDTVFPKGEPQRRPFRIEDGRGRPLGRSYRVKLWPTLVVLRDGEEVARVVRPQERGEVEQALAAGAPAPGEA